MINKKMNKCKNQFKKKIYNITNNNLVIKFLLKI